MLLTVPLSAAADPIELSASPRKSSTTPTRRTPPRAEEARKKGMLVLLVDDHPVNRMVLEKQLNSLGYAAEMAENGLAAIEKWKAGGVGAVITDCNMPEMDGFALARHIRDAEALRDEHRMPIIACTANALGGEAEKCYAAGMDDYLAKPVDLAQLQEKLRVWLPLAEVSTAATSKLQG
jgi:CheY-like chemotaxis protein